MHADHWVFLLFFLWDHYFWPLSNPFYMKNIYIYYYYTKFQHCFIPLIVTNLAWGTKWENKKWLKISLISYINREQRTVTHVALRRRTDEDSQQSPSASAHWFEHQENLQVEKKAKLKYKGKQNEEVRLYCVDLTY